MNRAAALTLLLLAGPLAAADLRITGNTAVLPYKLVRLKAEGLPSKAGHLWKVTPADPKNAVDWGSKHNAMNLEFVAPPGSYKVELTAGVVNTDGALELDAAEVVVTIGGTPPTPVPPGPVPPEPADPVFNALSLAFAVDGKPAAKVLALAAVYRQAAKDGGTADDSTIPTAGALLAELHVAGQTIAPDPELKSVRRTVADELNARIGGTTATPLTPALRAACKAQFKRVAALLEALR